MSRKETLLAIVLLLGLWFMASYVPPPHANVPAVAKLWSLTIEEPDGSLHDHYVIAQEYTQAHNLLLPNEGGDRQVVAYGNVAIPIAVYCGHGVTFINKEELE